MVAPATMVIATAVRRPPKAPMRAMVGVSSDLWVADREQRVWQ
jgi:hypothetical protein